MNRHLRSNFDATLKEEGIYSAVTAVAAKRVITHQIEKTQKLSIFSVLRLGEFFTLP